MAEKEKTTSNSNNPKRTTKEKVELLAIEELAKIYDIPQWVIAGLKQRHNWGIGKKITEDEFTKKVKGFLKGEMKKR